MAGDTVLVVESNATARSLLRVTLETYGYGVTDVADGAMALEAANRSTPDIVLLDLLLPDVEGAELARRLRARPGMADKPIVALIGFLAPATEDIEFDAVLEKPIDPTRLLSTVRWALRSLTAVRQNGEKDSPQSQGEPRFDEEARRAVPEVERQTKGKLELARKCALLETELTVLSRVADALATGRSPTDALKDVFLSSLDMAGIAKGALFRARDHLLELEHTTVLPAGEKDAVAQLFAEGTSIRLAIEQCRVLALPSPAMAEDDARDILLRCGVKSALIVPIVRGGTSYGAIFFGGRGLELTEPEPLAFGRALADQVARAFALIDRFERVSTEEKNLRGLVNSMQDLVVTFDREHRATGIHGRWSEDGSIHPREALGKRIEETVGFSDDPVHAE
ncbi:MAG TPA: response regulator, partial [Polyangiaceae bacterium]